ncbi:MULTISPECIES: type IV secretory system conjugative DNA transfer family protein [unclassified Devosia]|uniref:type IV secretory system conjugative DNA transfer family protein n=1 Tax=unclassified Devosia TaxID=196773 RepID=UPI001ACE77EA|nr:MULTISPECIES: type IV secretory system conjugative DNA transfer family protein [unclassified Devosia]MBN9304802.1 type IV secretory system conjugative DNA transfer family protein [Devosia sp.]
MTNTQMELKPFVPPRGSWNTVDGTAPGARWMNPEELSGPEWALEPGRLLLGMSDDCQEVAYGDDRHMVTIAGSRAGKTATVIVPNLQNYPGSAIVIDPKGELVELTALDRLAMGQNIRILDPFGEVKERGKLAKAAARTGVAFADESASFNPIAELREITNEDKRLGEAASLADAFIVSGETEPHWGDSAKGLVQAVALHLATGQSAYPADLNSIVRFFASTDVQEDVYREMKLNEAYFGYLKDVAATNAKRLDDGSKEYVSIISTANTQLAPLRDMRRISQESSFSLAALKAKEKTTLYLVLPASRMGTHFGWLRMIITLALSALERAPQPEGGYRPGNGNFPVLFLLEEFAALGYMRPIERAAGFIASFGVKLWPVLQDLQQLKRHYKDSWQTFLGNAGVIQVFGLNDGATEDMISQRLGNTQYEDDDIRRQSGYTTRQVNLPKTKRIGRLLEAHEVRMQFSRETHRQIILIPDLPPIALFRLPFQSA